MQDVRLRLVVHTKEVRRLTVVMRSTSPMQKLMNAFYSCFGLEGGKFLDSGHVIFGDYTPTQCGLQSGDGIEWVPSQLGD